jgi:fructokinase
MQNANSVFLNGHDVVGDLEKRLKMAVFIANDANCFALSEAVDGAGKDGDIVFGAILGTGCGGGVVVNQQVLTGANAISGEWGHNPLPGYDPQVDGDIGPCYCGRKHCIEQYISGTGFADQYNLKYGQSLKSQQIMELVEKGDADATQAYDLLVDQMARSFAAVTNILDPHVIVCGGGLSNIDRLYPDISKVITQYIFADKPKVNIRKAKFGDSSGVRGAAWLSR